jgi:hypothetical protein
MTPQGQIAARRLVVSGLRIRSSRFLEVIAFDPYLILEEHIAIAAVEVESFHRRASVITSLRGPFMQVGRVEISCMSEAGPVQRMHFDPRWR